MNVVTSQSQFPVTADSTSNFVRLNDGSAISFFTSGFEPQPVNPYDTEVEPYDVYGQRYLPDGQAFGAPFRVNSTTFHGQYYPVVLKFHSGEFVVAWSQTQTGSSFAIGYQRFDVHGLPVGSEVLITTVDDPVNTLVVTSTGGNGFLLYSGRTGEVFQVLDTNLPTLKIDGDQFDNTLTGDSANESLSGGAGNDILVGGGGDDILVGGSGINTLYGGDGNDTFVFQYLSTDTIVDTSGQNTLRVERAPDGRLLRIYFDDQGRLVLEGTNGSSVKVENPSTLSDIRWVPLTLQPGNTGYSMAMQDLSIGTLESDTLTTSTSPYVEVYGADGDDQITVIAQSSFVTGDGGSDLIYGGSGSDQIYGDYRAVSTGNDTIYGGDGSDNLWGGAGDDLLSAGSGQNLIDGGEGNDVFVFQYEGNTIVSDAAGGNWLRIERPADTLYFSRLYYNAQGGLVLEGMNGSSIVVSDPANLLGIQWATTDPVAGYSVYSMPIQDLVIGTLGHDLLSTSASAYIEAYGADGDDQITILGGSSWVTGDSGADVVYGGQGSDAIHGDFTAPDTGNDTLFGGGGNDVLWGEAGQDVLYGGEGNDLLKGDDGNDSLDGGAGNDFLDGGIGSDTLIGGDGNDVYIVDSMYDVVIEYTGGGTDEIIVSTFIYGYQLPPNSVEILTLTGSEEINGSGNAQANIISGNVAANWISGAERSDTLFGGGGNDTLLGGYDNANDTLDGGEGIDYAMYFGIRASTSITLDEFSGTYSVQADGQGIDTLSNIEYILLSYGETFYIKLAALTSGNDAWWGTSENERVEAFSGNDALSAGLGDDELLGGAGEDTIDGDVGNDTLDGGADNDTLIGRAGDDSLYGGSGDDLLSAGSGQNLIDGGEGNDVFVFQYEGNTIVSDAAGGNWLRIERPADTLYFSRLYYNAQGGLVLEGMNGSSIVVSDPANLLGIQWATTDPVAGYSVYSMPIQDLVIGTLGHDLLSTSASAYIEAYGADGDDQITILGGSSWVTGDSGADVVYGGQGSDAIHGDFTAPDTGNDTLFGGGGNDVLWGEAGQDVLYGGEGNDLLKGDDGNDSLDGGAGNDTIVGGLGQNTATYTGDRADYTITPNPVDGSITVHDLRGIDGTDTLTGITRLQFATVGFDLDIATLNVAPLVGASVNLGSTPEDSTVTITAADLLTGATDADGDTLTVANLVVSTGALINNNNGTWTWTPAANDTTSATFTYNVTDGTESVTQTATLDLTPVNDLPSIANPGGISFAGLAPLDLAASVTTVGDVNGDGYDDFLLGASWANGLTGSAYLVFGSSGLGQTQILLSELTGSNGIEISPYPNHENGNASEGFFGATTSELGDVDGDGFADFAVTQFSFSGAGVNEIIIFYGSSGQYPALATEPFNATDSTLTIRGPAASGFGTSIANLGDVNGDGFSDFGFGAPNSSVVYIMHGRDQALGRQTGILDLNQSDFAAVSGATMTGMAGYSIASAGDFNGDGRADYLISSAPFGSNPGIQSSVYLVFGSLSSTISDFDLDQINGSNGFRVTGDTPNSLVVTSTDSLSSIGDFNGDGYDDFVVGSSNTSSFGLNDNGEAIVLFGSNSVQSATLLRSQINGSNGFIVYGEQNQGILGLSVGSAGDVNGDGLSDLLVGSPYTKVDGKEAAGEVHLVFGQTGGMTASVAASSIANSLGYTFYGTRAGDAAGYHVSSAGDVNGDGRSDLLIAARLADVNGLQDAGEFYLVLGGTDNLSSLDAKDGVVDGRISLLSVSGGVSLSCLEDTSLFILESDLIANLFDADGDALSVTEISVSAGTVELVEPGKWVFTPPSNNSTSVDLWFTVSDGSGLIHRNGLIDLVPVNDAPVLSGPVGLASSYEDSQRLITTADLTYGASDVDGDSLVVKSLSASSGVLVEVSNGQWLYSPGLNFNGLVEFSYLLGDGVEFLPQTASMFLVPENDAPTGTVLIEGLAREGQRLSLNSTSVSDVDGLGLFSYKWFRDGLEIVNAIESSYVLTPSDIGTAISASVSYHDGFGTLESVLSASTALVVPAPIPGVTRTGTTRSDTLNGTGGDDVLSGLAGNDLLTGLGGNDRLLGGDGNDTLSGGLGGDTLDGGAGTDTATYAYATTGVAVSLAIATAQETGAGADQLIGIENLVGGNGNDTLSGNAGANSINGGGGDDLIIGGAGNDTLAGGANGVGGDTVSYAEATARVTVSLATTSAQNTGTASGRDVLSGFENLEGSAYADLLTGSIGNNVIRGGAGADSIIGGDGTDYLYGGEGADTFVFTANSNSRVGIARDVIIDLELGDVLDFSAIDANTALRGNQAFTFIGSSAFSSAGQLRMYEADGTWLVEGNTGGTIDPDFQLELRQWNAANFSDTLL